MFANVLETHLVFLFERAVLQFLEFFTLFVTAKVVGGIVFGLLEIELYSSCPVDSVYHCECVIMFLSLMINVVVLGAV